MSSSSEPATLDVRPLLAQGIDPRLTTFYYNCLIFTCHAYYETSLPIEKNTRLAVALFWFARSLMPAFKTFVHGVPLCQSLQ